MTTPYTQQDKKVRKTWSLVAMFFVFAALPMVSLARGGGGGSGGGGGGGGGGHGGSGSGSLVGLVIYGVIALIVYAVAAYHLKKRKEKAKKVIEAAEGQDPVWNESEIIAHVRKVFPQFQNDWSAFGIDSMKTYLTESYWKRMVLELNVLKNENRQNLVKNPNLRNVAIIDASDSLDNAKDSFTVQVDAQAHDVLVDTELNKELFIDNSAFTEYWDFVRVGDEWKLDLIRQATEDKLLREPAIESFSQRNNFFYDPDFGWLMMPNKGVIFRKSNFKTSDINNHVVGYFRDKIVEFYTFVPNTGSRNASNYVVAQVALPIKYKDILVRRKHFLWNMSPSGLRRIQTESNDFDKRFCLWADPEDQVSSFELLTPNFMEKIYELPFELNIEVVGSFLYFYAKSRKDVNYDKMLEILSWAFDEMKM